MQRLVEWPVMIGADAHMPCSPGTVIQDPVADIIVSQRISAWLAWFRFPSWLTVPGSFNRKTGC